MGLFSKKTEEEKMEQRNKQKEKNERYASFMGTTVQNIGPIARGSIVTISLDPQNRKLIISWAKTKLEIPYEHIIGFSLDDEVSLSKGKTSLGGAVIGGALFGPAGALIGASRKKGNTDVEWIGTLRYYSKDGSQQELNFIEYGILGNYTGKNKNTTHAFFEKSVNNIVTGNVSETTLEL